MKRVRFTPQKSLLAFYKNLLLENGYSFKKQTFYRKVLKNLELVKGRDFLLKYLPLLVKYFEDLREKVDLPYRFSFPHPILLNFEKVIQFLEEVSSQKDKKKTFFIGQYIPELLFVFSYLVREGNEEKIKEKIKEYLDVYEKERIYATIVHIYRLLKRGEDELFRRLFHFLHTEGRNSCRL